MMGAAKAIVALACALNSPATSTLLGLALLTTGLNFRYGSLVYASESFPARLRTTQGGSAMLTSELLATFIIGVVCLGALGSPGGSVTFGISLATVYFTFVYALAPETKGRPLARREKHVNIPADAGINPSGGPIIASYNTWC